MVFNFFAPAAHFGTFSKFAGYLNKSADIDFYSLKSLFKDYQKIKSCGSVHSISYFNRLIFFKNICGTLLCPEHRLRTIAVIHCYDLRSYNVAILRIKPEHKHKEKIKLASKFLRLAVN